MSSGPLAQEKKQSFTDENSTASTFLFNGQFDENGRPNVSRNKEKLTLDAADQFSSA